LLNLGRHYPIIYISTGHPAVAYKNACLKNPAMIRSSFIFLAGIGQEKERMIWKQGIRHWCDYRRHKAKGISEVNWRIHCLQLDQAAEALDKDDSAFFVKLLKGTETWRLFSHFSDEAAYLDIETSGLSRDSEISVVGIYRDDRWMPLVHGINLHGTELRKALAGCSMLVTYNGSAFDLPMIRRRYPGSLPDVPHMDLLHVCRKVGLTGGLKSAEASLGLRRRPQVGGLHGGDAALLWRMYRASKDRHYLDLLLEYNEEDTANMPIIAAKATSMLSTRMMSTIEDTLYRGHL
jgi:uncharacterized protein